jgi:hypothetical protein
MKISMTGQEKGDLFIQVTAWADLTVFVIQALLQLFVMSY